MLERGGSICGISIRMGECDGIPQFIHSVDPSRNMNPQSITEVFG
jgi:hypothetical protein